MLPSFHRKDPVRPDKKTQIELLLVENYLKILKIIILTGKMAKS